jgi:hypothetical protein
MEVRDMSDSHDEDRTPQILYGEAADLKDGPPDDEIVLKLGVASACWKSNDEVVFDQARGQVFLTEDKLLFQCFDTQERSAAIDAECIMLHAQSEDCAIYLQLQDYNSRDENEVMDMTLTLKSPQECQELFNSLTHLVSQHPVYEADEGGMMGVDDEYGDHMIVAPDEQQQAAGEPSEEERNAMLERLDAMLVVPSHLEVKDGDNDDNGGQFDDAESDDLL